MSATIVLLVTVFVQYNVIMLYLESRLRLFEKLTGNTKKIYVTDIIAIDR